MATITQLEAALKGAHQAGDTDAARRIAAILVKERENVSNYVPTDEGSYAPIPGTEPTPSDKRPQSIGEQVLGAGEAALTVGTGATAGTLGMLGGTLKGLAEKILSGEFGTPEAANYVEQQAMKGAEALTYAPRTQSGQETVEAIGEVLEPLAGIAPIAPELQGLGAATRAAGQSTAAAATQIASKAKPIIQNVLKPVETVGSAPPSAGAAGVNPGLKRQTLAEQLPVPIKLTEGQKTRQFEQQRFERETAKMQEEGAPLRERFAQQNAQLQQNLDAFIDETGGQAPDLRSVGMSVDQALRKRAARDKAEIRTLYKEAEKAGEMAQPVNLDKVVKVLNESRSAESTAPVLVAARKELLRLGGAIEDADGNLVAKFQPNRSTSGGETYTVYKGSDPDMPNPNDFGIAGHGTYYSGMENVAKTYAGRRGKVSQSQVTLQNPLKITETELFELQKKLYGKLVTGFDEDLSKQFDKHLKDKGYDGVVIFDERSSTIPVEVVKFHNVASTQSGPGTSTSEVTVFPTQTAKSQGSISLGDTEQLRKFVNKVSGNDPTNIKFAADIKRAIDESTEGQGGDLYKQARKARAKYARNYEDVQVVDQLLGTKRGSSDRSVAMEDVLQKVVLAPSTSLDSMRHMRRLIQTKGGDEGKQAWRDLQAGTLQHIKDQMTKNSARDQAGNAIVSPAQLDRVITQLDKSGKLDYIFGPKGAEQLRLINDVSKDVLTSPPGAVNHSNTATVLAGLMDVALSGATGVPAPVATSFRLLTKSIKDAKLKARVQQSLGDKQ